MTLIETVDHSIFCGVCEYARYLKKDEIKPDECPECKGVRRERIRTSFAAHPQKRRERNSH